MSTTSTTADTPLTTDAEGAPARRSRRGPDIWPALLNAVRRAVADGARTYADVYAATGYHPGHVRRAVGELVRRGELVVTGGTRPVRIALAEPAPDAA